MRRTLALTALLLAAPLLRAQAPPTRTLPKNPTFKTGESPEAPLTPLARKLRSDFESANAAAQAALSRLKSQAVPKPLTQEQKLALAAHAAGVDKPCDRTLFNVEGAAANFTIQPGQLILVNGCFKGSSNAEVRIEGNFPDGRLLLEVQDRGDGYFYGKVPDVAGVPDQPVSVCVRFFSDGYKTAPRNGFFYAKRQTWDVTVDERVCRSLRVNGNAPQAGSYVGAYWCWSEKMHGVETWSSSRRADGYKLTKFWWKAVLENSMGSFHAPASLTWSDDGSSVLVTLIPDTAYAPSRVRIEGPAGLTPF
jgi:hypothetical protein